MKSVKIIFIACELVAILGTVALAYASCDFTVASLISVLTVWAIACQKEQQEIELDDEEYVESI